MKALVIASLVFFSLRAMSAVELGEDKKTPCPFANQSNKREAKLVIADDSQKTNKEEVKVISK